MGTTVTSTGITFPDASTQTTAASGGASDIDDLSDGKTNGYGIGLGGGALENITTTNSNIAIGHNAQHTATSAAGNVAIGNSAAYANLYGGANVAIGDESLKDCTGSGGVSIGYAACQNYEGGNITGVGKVALHACTTGYGNTGLGYEVGRYITTGSNNTTVGYQAGTALTTGSNNTIIGRLSGGSATLSGTVLIGAGTTERLKVDSTGLYVNGSTTALEGGASDIDGLSDGYYDGESIGLGSGALASDDGTDNYNVAVGKDAATATTSGYRNCAVGWWSLKSNISGNSNVAIGAAALKSNTYGEQNTAIGGQALFYNTTGDGNTAIGYDAAKATTTAEDNTAVGHGALTNITTGVRNIAIGHSAGAGLTTGHENVIIGKLAAPTTSMFSTVLVGCGTTERLKIDSTGLYVNGSTTALGGGGPSNPTGLVSGRYYTGLYDSEVTSAANLPTSSVLYYPIMVHEDCTIDELCVVIDGGTGNSGDLAQIALYGPVPDNLQSVPFITKTATFAVDSGYGKTLSITAQTVTKGIYLYSITTNTASLSVRKHNSQTKYINHMVGVSSPSFRGGCYGAQWGTNTVTTFPHSYPSTINASQANHTGDAWQFKYGVQ